MNTSEIYKNFLKLETPTMASLKNLIKQIHINEFEVDTTIIQDIPKRFNIKESVIESLLMPTFENVVNEAITNSFATIERNNNLTIHRSVFLALERTKQAWFISDSNYHKAITKRVNHMFNALVDEQQATGFPSKLHIQQFTQNFSKYISNDSSECLSNMCQKNFVSVSNAKLYKSCKNGIKLASKGELTLSNDLITYVSDMESITLKKSLVGSVSYDNGMLTIYRKTGKTVIFETEIDDAFMAMIKINFKGNV